MVTGGRFEVLLCVRSRSGDEKGRMVMMNSLTVSCFLAVLVVGFCARFDDSPGGSGGVSENDIESVADTEKRLKKLVNSGVKFALPYVMSTVTEIKIQTSCMRGLLKLMRGVMDIKDWAVRMVDALGKPSAGILEGTATAMGDYDECLDIVVPKNTRAASSPPYSEKEIDYEGQYCVVQIHIPEGIRQAAMAYQAGNRTNSDLANSKTRQRYG
ncbi:uncharacterized protein LOC129220715 [Uloborus diversus]|uniref:uncharacterized protein LOC129220715 n=1 Tax=Uloborus diversus TaxID=327109 RepID=UPI00240A1003|nr:uncharacterized protein LOC129220715 [Uloborus diversus]